MYKANHLYVITKFFTGRMLFLTSIIQVLKEQQNLFCLNAVMFTTVVIRAASLQ